MELKRLGFVLSHELLKREVFAATEFREFLTGVNKE
jgi:hypothetical protein